MPPQLGDSAPALTDVEAGDAIAGLLFSDGKKEPQPAAAETPETSEETPESTEETPEAGDEPEVAEESPEESDAPDESEDAPEEQPPAPERRKVKTPDGEEEVTFDEALLGYSRQKDYTRKTQALAEDKRAFEAEQTAVRAERQRTAQLWTDLEATLAGLTQEPDWDALRNEDPVVFAQTHAAFQINKERLARVQAEKAAAQAKVDEDNARVLDELISAESAKFAAIVPEWNDPEKGDTLRKDLVVYGQERGFTPRELNVIADHRALIVLHKAMLYDRMQAAAEKEKAKGKAKVDAVRTAPPRPAPKPKKATEDTKARERLKKTGRVEDAGEALKNMFQ